MTGRRWIELRKSQHLRHRAHPRPQPSAQVPRARRFTVRKPIFYRQVNHSHYQLAMLVNISASGLLLVFVFLPSSMPPVKGKEEVEKMYRAFFPLYREIKHEAVIEEIRIAGDWAFLWGTDELRLTPESEELGRVSVFSNENLTDHGCSGWELTT
jgi:hypothetical protein